MSTVIDFTGLPDAASYTFPAGWSVVKGTFKIQGVSGTGLLRTATGSPTVALADIPSGASTTQYKIRWRAGFTGGGSDWFGGAFSDAAGVGFAVACQGTSVKLYSLTTGWVIGFNLGSGTTTAIVAGEWFTATFDINGASSVIKVYQESGSTTTPVLTRTVTYPTGMKMGVVTNWGNNNSEGIQAVELDYGNPIIDTITPTPKLGDTVSITTSSLGTLTSVTVGGVSATAINAPSGDGTFVIPTWVNNSVGVPLGTQYVVVGDGVKTTGNTDKQITVGAPTGKSFVQLTSVNNSIGYLGYYVSGLEIGAQVEFSTAASLGVSANFIDDDGGIYSDYAGTQTVRVRDAASGTVVAHQITLGSVADTQPDVFTFTAATGVVPSAVTESGTITVSGVDSGIDIPISVVGGEYAVNTGAGFGAYTAAATNVRLGYTVKVRGVASASYSTATNVVLTVGGVSDTFTITTLAAPAPTLVSINSGSVLANSTDNTVTTTGYTAATGLTIGGVPMTSFAGSGNAYTFSVPALANGIVYPPMGSATATITDGTNAANLNVTFAPKATQGYVTLTSVTVAVGYVGNYITCTVGDQIIFDLPATLAVTANGVDVDGRFFSDYSGTQTMYHRNHVTGVITELSVITPAAIVADTTPDVFSFASVTGAEFTTNVTSAATVIAGITPATPVAISITGGTYSKNGGAYTASAGTVVLGDIVTVRVVASAAYTTLTSATLNIGGTTATFNATTRAAITAPTSFTLTAVTGAALSSVNTSNSITVLGIDGGAVTTAISITGGTYSINGGAYVSTAGTVKLNDTVTVRVTASGTANTGVSATLSIGGVTGIYNVSTVLFTDAARTKTLTGTVSQYAAGINKPNGALGFTPTFEVSAKEAIGANPAFPGIQTASMKVAADSSAVIDGKSYTVSVTGGSPNDNFGITQGITKQYRYGIVNLQAMVKFPTGWDFTAGGSHLKFLRIHTATAAHANIGYHDIYINDADRRLMYIYEGVLEWVTANPGYELRYDTWETIEFRVVLDTVSKDSGGQGRATVWIKRGSDFIKIIDCTSKATMLNATDECDQFNIFTYWNGNAPKTQSMSIQRVVVETDQNKLIAVADGMKIIGGEFSNA